MGQISYPLTVSSNGFNDIGALQSVISQANTELGAKSFNNYTDGFTGLTDASGVPGDFFVVDSSAYYKPTTAWVSWTLTAVDISTG